MDEGNEGVICLSLNGLPSEFRQFLEKRYGEKLLEKKNRFFIDQTDAELRDMASQIHKRLFPRSWAGAFFNLPFSDVGEQPVPEIAVREIMVGRFYRSERIMENRKATFYSKSPSQICLNYNNDHIHNLIDMMFSVDQTYADLAAHFLVREILFTEGLEISIIAREQMLIADLMRRFPSLNEPSKHRSLMDLIAAFFSEKSIEI